MDDRVRSLWQPSAEPENLGAWTRAACWLEATARKPGNVHPGANFSDCTYDDFLTSAQAIAPIFDRTEELSVGEIILAAVQASRAGVGKNTNLGIILLLAPLAKARSTSPTDIHEVLSGLTLNDADLAYRAIRLAAPGGLGTSSQQDVRDQPTVTLLEAMTLACDRDLIARQYTDGFKETSDLLLPDFLGALEEGMSLEQGIIRTYLTGLARLGDTLVLRKCGPLVVAELRRRAQEILKNGQWRASAASKSSELSEFDFWLRADGNRRNPGTMADLMAAVLFLAFRQGSLTLPLQRPW